MDRGLPRLSEGMATREPTSAYVSLVDVDLGDIVALPDGRELTVRARVVPLEKTVGSMYGFVLAGEIGPNAVLLSVPARTDGPTVIYSPLDHVPAFARDAQPVCEGAMSYWAPHLPGFSGAMGELTYRVCRIRGHVEPMVLVWRGNELVVFIKSSVTPAHTLRYLLMPRSEDSEVAVVRHASIVRDAPTAPTQQPAPPARTPERVPVLPGRRFRGR